MDRLLNLQDPGLPAVQVITAHGLAPHQACRHDQETWRDGPADGGRGAGTAIFDPVASGKRNDRHGIDAPAIPLWQTATPLPLSISAEGRVAEEVRIGPDLAASRRLQAAMPPGLRQAARTLGAWSLVADMVAPACSCSGFELAPGGSR
jgi:predicted cupin superfamily sugar epimerase